MDIWEKLFNEAKKVQNKKRISQYWNLGQMAILKVI